MSLERFAESELRIAGMFDADSDYHGAMGQAVLKMVKLFAEEGHSGASAAMAIGLFERLARCEPLTPITGAPDEWMEVDEGVFQNLRCAHVFKDSDGRAYDTGGEVLRGSSDAFASSDRRVYIEFPYLPDSPIGSGPPSSPKRPLRDEVKPPQI